MCFWGVKCSRLKHKPSQPPPLSWEQMIFIAHIVPRHEITFYHPLTMWNGQPEKEGKTIKTFMVSKPSAHNAHNGPQPAGIINYLNAISTFTFTDVFWTDNKPHLTSSPYLFASFPSSLTPHQFYQHNSSSPVPPSHQFLSLVLTLLAIRNCFINAFIFHSSIFLLGHKADHAEQSAEFRIRHPSSQSSFGKANCLKTLDTKHTQQTFVCCNKLCIA